MADCGRIIDGCQAWREPKNPEDQEQYSIDLTTWLGDEDLVSAVWSVDFATSGLVIEAQSVEGNVAHVMLSAGDLGNQKVKITAETATRSRVRNIIVEVKDC